MISKYLKHQCQIACLQMLIASLVCTNGFSPEAHSFEPQDDTKNRPRIRDVGISPGVLPTGQFNAITDVQGVMVGHTTLIAGDDVRTGVTAILPHAGNLYKERVPAAVVVANGNGKMMGISHIQELGEIESPIMLTNTNSVEEVAQGVFEWTISQAGNNDVYTVNAVVGETNDGYLNDIRLQSVLPKHAIEAIQEAHSGRVLEGNVGAGTGTRAFEWKGGIGTSSRRIPESLGGYTVGVLVQVNFGGSLRIDGVRIGEILGQYDLMEYIGHENESGSVMIVVATDAPLSDRNLTRLGRRAFFGLARTGSIMENGSGDYVIAFSTSIDVRRTETTDIKLIKSQELKNYFVTPLFMAVIEATEEAIYNAMFKAQSMHGFRGEIEALPLDDVLPLLIPSQ